ALDIFEPVRPDSPTSLHFNTASNSLASSRANSPRPPSPQAGTMDSSRFLFNKPKFSSNETSTENIRRFITRCNEFFTMIPNTDDDTQKMPRDIPDRKSKLLDALSMSPYHNEIPTMFALCVRSAAGTEWNSLPEKTAVDSIRSKLPSTVNIFLQSWNDRIRNLTHLLDAFCEYESCALNQNPPVPTPSTAIPEALDEKLDTVLARLTKLESK
ncbi:unnamed protein product, partial [Allacma fusca]